MSQREMGVLLDTYGNQYKEEMNFKRWQTFSYIRCHTDHYKKPQDLLKFSWDNDEIKLSQEEINKRKQHLLNLINK